MLKDIRKKVMQIANRLVKLGYIRACAMATAWKIVKTHNLSTRVAGTSFDNRQDVLGLIAKLIRTYAYTTNNKEVKD